MSRLRIKIYPDNKHQVIAIPVNGKVTDIFINKIDEFVKAKYGKSVNDFIEFVSFYDNRNGRYKDCKPNLTPTTSSEHNFDLVSINNDVSCINVFQVITKDFKEELFLEIDINCVF
jgi:hypothetical protein